MAMYLVTVMTWTKLLMRIKSSDQAIVNAYVAKTGLEESVIIDMMKNETFMSASEAVEKGFADEVMTFEDIGAVASLENGLLPQAVIDDFYANRSKCKSEIQNMLREIRKRRITQRALSSLFYTQKEKKGMFKEKMKEIKAQNL